MELQKLKYFHTVAKLQHVTRAAEQLQIAQPALTQAIRSLEGELGVELFVMDDGWFKNRNDDNAGLGDWVPDLKKLPHGLDGLIGECGTEHASDCEDVILLTPYYANSSDATTKGFVDAYNEKFNATPDQFAADGYDAVLAIAEAIKKNGFTADQLMEITAEDFNKKMVGVMTQITVTGATGVMTWTADGETDKDPRVLQIKNGAYVEYGTAQ